MKLGNVWKDVGPAPGTPETHVRQASFGQIFGAPLAKPEAEEELVVPALDPEAEAFERIMHRRMTQMESQQEPLKAARGE